LAISWDNNGSIITPGFEKRLNGQLPFRGNFAVFVITIIIAKPQCHRHLVPLLVFHGDVLQQVRINAQIRAAIAVSRVRNTDLTVIGCGGAAVFRWPTSAVVGLAVVIAHTLAADDVTQADEIGLFGAVVTVLRQMQTVGSQRHSVRVLLLGQRVKRLLEYRDGGESVSVHGGRQATR